ncbi:CAP domain-containing protein [Janthinobacterium sp. BJB301]|uniref:CAP domain-containing protein n=1 Tax=Janthinobacterium sp. BJB301 TaxID=1560195 RepID=UPI001179F8A1|nr:CAP domain-containing protein [Janthinobacterium sp. BJB301]
MKTIQSRVLAAAVATLLIACGGGGGGGDTEKNTEIGVTPPITPPVTPPVTPPINPPVTPPVIPPAVDSTIQTEVLLATYAVGTEQRYAYDYLNAQRLACGFGLLQQDSKLDVAAQGHASYLSVNHLVSHYQNQVGYPNGFTGTTLNDRLTNAGYVATSGAEVLTELFPYSAYQSYGSSYGQSAVMDFFTAPYHGNGILQGQRDVGIGFGVTDTYWRRVVINIGSTASRTLQQINADNVLTYPCEGTTGVLSKSYTDEIPSPIAGRRLLDNPIGHPIYVKVRDGNILVLSGYVLRKTGTNLDIPLQLLNKENDPNRLITDSSVAILMPLFPLEKNSSYEFASTGMNSGIAISVSFTFATGMY